MKAVTLPIVVALLSLPALSVANAQTAAPAAKTTSLDVSAEGEVRRVPDMASISAGVVTQAATASAAMQENATRMAAVVAALKKAGIADRDIQTSSLNLSPQYRYQENQPPQLIGYQASNTVQIVFRKISNSGRIIDTLVAQGANQINGPSLTIEKADEALDEARVAAIAKARARADLYAKAAGLRVKRIVSIRENGTSAPNPPYPMPRMMMAKAESDTAVQAGESALSVTVNVSFELE